MMDEESIFAFWLNKACTTAELPDLGGVDYMQVTTQSRYFTLTNSYILSKVPYCTMQRVAAEGAAAALTPATSASAVAANDGAGDGRTVSCWWWNVT